MGLLDIASHEVRYGRFIRRTGHSITTGKVVAYVMTGAPEPFTITVTREAIDIKGRIVANEIGAEALQDILSRAVKHYLHLKSFAIGEVQTILDEATLYNATHEVPITTVQ